MRERTFGPASGCARLRAVRLEPAKAVLGAALGPVFAPDEAIEAGLVQNGEQERVVHLAGVGLVAVRNTGDLDMPGQVGICSDPSGEIALRDLAVIQVELQ